jgi:hypothetical protein
MNKSWRIDSIFYFKKLGNAKCVGSDMKSQHCGDGDRRIAGSRPAEAAS